MLPLLLLLACEPARVATDVARYDQLLREGFTDPEQALGVCASLSDPALAGDCALVIAMQASKGMRQDPAVWCARVPEGAWRDECHFEGAEMMARRGQTERAAALCGAAGAFRDDCGMHLWMGELSRVSAGMGPGQLQERLPTANQLYERWAPALAEHSDMETRYWQMFYQAAFGPSAAVDLSLCAPLPPEDARRCEAAGAERFLGQLTPFLVQSGRIREFCGTLLSAQVVAPWLGAAPHPALDQALAARRGQICEQGR